MFWLRKGGIDSQCDEKEVDDDIRFYYKTGQESAVGYTTYHSCSTTLTMPTSKKIFGVSKPTFTVITSKIWYKEAIRVSK